MTLCALDLGSTLFLLDSQLSYTQHLHNVANKVTALLYNTVPVLVRDSTQTQYNKLTLYKLLIPSILTYAAPVCSFTCPFIYFHLPVIQSECLRVIGNYPRRTPSSHLHDTL